MGALSVKKFIRLVAGVFTEENAVTTSSGVTDADKIPALNALGILDKSIINGTQQSAGAADANKPIMTGADGRLDVTFLPNGIGPDVGVFIASEALSANDLVNKWNNAGVTNIRKADAATNKKADGYVKAAVASGAQGTVYNDGINSGLTGLTPGDQWLSATTPGKCSSAIPTGSGQLVQSVGFADSATELAFEAGTVVKLA